MEIKSRRLIIMAEQGMKSSAALRADTLLFPVSLHKIKLMYNRPEFVPVGVKKSKEAVCVSQSRTIFQQFCPGLLLSRHRLKSVKPKIDLPVSSELGSLCGKNLCLCSQQKCTYREDRRIE